MQRHFSLTRQRLLKALRADKHVRVGVFSEKFSEEDFIEFILISLLSLGTKKGRVFSIIIK